MKGKTEGYNENIMRIENYNELRDVRRVESSRQKNQSRQFIVVIEPKPRTRDIRPTPT